MVIVPIRPKKYKTRIRKEKELISIDFIINTTIEFPQCEICYYINRGHDLESLSISAQRDLLEKTTLCFQSTYTLFDMDEYESHKHDIENYIITLVKNTDEWKRSVQKCIDKIEVGYNREYIIDSFLHIGINNPDFHYRVNEYEELIPIH